MTEPSRRLFFALWPEPALQRRLHRLADEQTRSCGGRLVPAHNLHLTLAFPGRVDAAVQRCLEQGAGRLRFPSFGLTIDRSGYWAKPRVAWLGGGETPVTLRLLAAALQEVMAECGLQPERRAFAAHVTVRRKALRPPTKAELGAVSWPVGDFVLAESLTLPEGAQYRVVRRWPLDAPAAVRG